MSAMGPTSVPRRVCILGAGEIGAGWAGLFAAYGAEVRLFDPDPAAVTRARAALTDAVRVGAGVSDMGSIDAYVDLPGAAEDAEWVQESLPEDLALKRTMLGALARMLPEFAVVASSTSTYTATELASELPYAARLLVAHPLHPVYAVPAVELCAGEATSPAATERALAVLRGVGREPVLVRAELPGLVANRLAAALLREAMELVARGVVTAAELDRLVARGIALGWAASGPLGTEALGAGAVSYTGLARFLDRLEAPLGRIWGSLAGWDALPADRRAMLLAAIRESDRREERILGTHVSGEPSWAETLARVLRAAEGEPDALP